MTALNTAPRAAPERAPRFERESVLPAGALELLLDHRQFSQPTCWRSLHFAAGSVVVQRGSRSEKLYVVLEGEVRVLATATLSGGREIHPGIADLGPGEVFGELALFERPAHCASVRALSQCHIAVIDLDRLLQFMENHPEIGYAVLKTILAQVAPRFRKMNARLCHLLAWGMKAHQLDRF